MDLKKLGLKINKSYNFDELIKRMVDYNDVKIIVYESIKIDESYSYFRIFDNMDDIYTYLNENIDNRYEIYSVVDDQNRIAYCNDYPIYTQYYGYGISNVEGKKLYKYLIDSIKHKKDSNESDDD